jgi:hypothetical protein
MLNALPDSIPENIFSAWFHCMNFIVPPGNEIKHYTNTIYMDWILANPILVRVNV